MRHTRVIVLVVLLFALLVGCAAGPNTAVEGGTHEQLAGFWLGLWHGMIAPLTFIVSLFNDNVNIYEVRNSGNWYDFGFVLGAGILFGSSGSASSRR